MSTFNKPQELAEDQTSVQSKIETSAKKDNAMLADAVTKAMTDRGWSLRAAATYTGLSANTIDRMKKGSGVEAEALIKFGKAAASKGEETQTARYFLRVGGKREIVALIDATEREARSAAGSEPVPVSMLTANGERLEIVEAGGEPVSVELTPPNVAAFAAVGRAIREARG